MLIKMYVQIKNSVSGPASKTWKESIWWQLGGASVPSFGVQPTVAALVKRKETLTFKLSGKKKKTIKSK